MAPPQRWHRLGVSKIDLLVLSHRHPDHFGGTFRLLEDLPINRCVIPRKDSPTSDGQWHSLLRELRRHHVQCQPVHAGYKFQIFDLKAQFLAPLAAHSSGDSKDENDWSLGAIFSTEDGRVWAFGDAPKELEMDILALNPTHPGGGVLLVPHHGSDTSSSQELLDGIKPDLALVSHKRPLPNRVLARYRKRGIPVCGTNPGGTVHVRLRKNKIWVPMGCFIP